MKRHFVALAALAAALASLPDVSSAAPGIRGGGVRIGGFRPIPQFRGLRHGTIRGPHLVSPRPHPGPVGPVHPGFSQVKIPPSPVAAFTFRGSRLVRLDHARHRKGGLILPVTGYGDIVYFGVPYDPTDAILVYAPQPLIQQIDDDPPPAGPIGMPQLTRARGENQDACSAEKVTVPAAEGQRDITVVRC